MKFSTAFSIAGTFIAVSAQNFGAEPACAVRFTYTSSSLHPHPTLPTYFLFSSPLSIPLPLRFPPPVLSIYFSSH